MRVPYQADFRELFMLGQQLHGFGTARADLGVLRSENAPTISYPGTELERAVVTRGNRSTDATHSITVLFEES